LKYSTKIYGYDQTKVFQSYQLDSPKPSTDILNHCERGTCAALAARWAFERANSKYMLGADRMFPTTYTSKSGYARSKRPGQVDPKYMKRIEETREASERFHQAYPTGMSLEQWRGAINQLAEESIEERLKDDRQQMKKKLQEKQFDFYQKVAEM